MTGRTQFPSPWFADGRRRKDHRLRSRTAEWRAYQATWQKPIDELVCTPEAFYHLRATVLGLNRKQVARLLRVSVNSVLNWERGTHELPFPAFVSLVLISESHRYRLAAEAWREWEFVYRFVMDVCVRKAQKRRYVAYLVDRMTGAEFEPEDLRRYALAMAKLAALEGKNLELRGSVERLARENAELRELSGVEGVTDELHGMRERVEALLCKFSTTAALPMKKLVAA